MRSVVTEKRKRRTVRIYMYRLVKINKSCSEMSSEDETGLYSAVSNVVFCISCTVFAWLKLISIRDNKFQDPTLSHVLLPINLACKKHILEGRLAYMYSK
jgi:hypothetical protein